MNLNEPLIGDTTKSIKVYEASKILKRCKGIDYYVDENEDSTTIVISTSEELLSFLTIDDDNYDIFVSFNMRLDPVTVVDLTTLFIELSSHIDMGLVFKESFLTVGDDENFKILYGDDASMELGYSTLKWNNAEEDLDNIIIKS